MHRDPTLMESILCIEQSIDQFSTFKVKFTLHSIRHQRENETLKIIRCFQ